MKLFGNKRGGSRANREPENMESLDIMEELNIENESFDSLDSSYLDGFQSESISDDIMLEDSATVFSMANDYMPPIEQYESDTMQETPSKKKRLTGLQKGLIILGAVILFVVLMIVVMWNNLGRAPDISQYVPPSTNVNSNNGDLEQQGTSATAKVTTTTIVTEDPNTGEPVEMLIEVPVGRKANYYTVLLVGTDASDALTDTIMLASFDIDNGKLNIVSIPRDTITDGTWNTPKINSAYMAGGQGEEGIELLKSKVSKITGIPIDCYALIDLKAFVEIIDIIGGVWFYVPQRMYYSDPTQNLLINLNAGEQLLTGNMAMQLVRFRGYDAADLARVEVQQDFMKACAKQLLQMSNSTKLSEIMNTLSENLMTNMTLGNIAFFGRELANISVDDIETFTLPGAGISWQGLSYYALYGQDVLELINESFNPYDTDLTIDDINPLTISGGIRVKSTKSSTSGSVYGNSISSGSSGSSSSGSGTATQTTPVASPAPVSEPEPEASGDPVEASAVDGQIDENQTANEGQSGETGLESGESNASEANVPGNVVETKPEELPGGPEDNITPTGENIAG